MKPADFKRVTVDAEVAETPIARRYAAWAGRQDRPVADRSAERATVHAGHTLTSGKREVHVTRFRGQAVKQCSGLEEHYTCCNLHIMNQTTNCPLECSYCILQAYLNSPVTTVHANVDEMVAQVEVAAARQPGRLFRVGTGDLGDALALDPIGGVTRELVPRFGRMPNVVLELKTKSNCVDQLLELDHGGRTVVAWSLNTPHVVSTEEHLCATLDERLAAARRVVEAGYLVAFHFDPMIVHEGWETAYPEAVRRLFGAVDARRIAWISLGSLRFPPAMRATMQERFPASRLPLGELVLGADGKMRYLKPLRLRLYRAVLQAIDDAQTAAGLDEDSAIWTYLCMEPAEVWRRAMGRVYESNNALDYAFSHHLVARFPAWMPGPIDWADYAEAVNLGVESVTH